MFKIRLKIESFQLVIAIIVITSILLAVVNGFFLIKTLIDSSKKQDPLENVGLVQQQSVEKAIELLVEETVIVDN